MQHLQQKLRTLTENDGVEVSHDMQLDLQKVIECHNPEVQKLPMDDCKRVFWEQQVS